MTQATASRREPQALVKGHIVKHTHRAMPARMQLAACLALFAAGPLMAATPTGHPPVGDYRIDSDTTTTHTTMAGTLKTEQHIEGATGRTPVTQTAPGTPPVSRVLAGEGPYSACMTAPSAPPPRGIGMACTTGSYSASTGG